MGDCGVKCMKYLLFVFNFIIWLGGGGMLALGIILYFGLQSWIPIDEVATLLDNNDEYLEYSAYILMGAGGLVFLVGFCGCCGALTECRYLLVMYFLFLFVLFCGQIAAGILASIYSMDIEEAIDTSMIEGFEAAYGNGTNAAVLRDAWQIAEATLDCCGYNSGKDYDNTPDGLSFYFYSDYKFAGFPDFPPTCCVGASHPDYKVDDAPGCKSSWDDDDTTEKDTTTYHGTGCKTTVKDLIEEYSNWIRGGAIGLAVLELVCMVFAICICRNIEDD